MTEIVYQVALSFAGEDREYVEQVAFQLQKMGIIVFYDKFEETDLWGKNLYDYLTNIYKNKAEYTVMFISKHYANKLWTNHERKAMQARAFQDNQEYILPARFDDTDIPGILSTVGYISLVDKSPEEFAKMIRKKIISSGGTIPSESFRNNSLEMEKLRLIDPIKSEVIIIDNDKPVVGATVVAIADNSTTKKSITSKEGIAQFKIHTQRNYTLLIAHPMYNAIIINDWDPSQNGLKISMPKENDFGSIIIESTGYIPGFEGRLNPILDTHNRMYLYAGNIAINGGLQQPVHFEIGVPFQLEDSNGTIIQIFCKYINGSTSLFQYTKNSLI